jgi:hypothetical protein
MGERPYTDADVELVARTYHELGFPDGDFDWESVCPRERAEGRAWARAILDALAAAGRLRMVEVTESLRGGSAPKDIAVDLAAHAGYELGRQDERAALEDAGRLLPADAREEIEFLRAELARHRDAFLAIRDTTPMMDDPEWRRLVNRAVAAGYEPSVVTRFQRKPDSLGHINIVAAYQQGWRDCVAMAERARARPVSSESTEEGR